jgi:hypothetical protein
MAADLKKAEQQMQNLKPKAQQQPVAQKESNAAA